MEARPDPPAMCSSRSRPGVNHAETHMREGKWPEATEISAAAADEA
jgi:hypothetical protein